MLKFENVSAGYGCSAVIENVTLSAQAGEVLVLLGPNGCGKSTLLKAVVGLAQVTAGKIQVDGTDISALEPAALAKQIAYLPQGRNVPQTTVERLVLCGRFPYLSYPRRYRGEDYAAARSAMERLGILELAREPLSRLSGGLRQKAYIAMALAQNSPAVLLDEPSASLDVAHQLDFARLCRELAEDGKEVVVVLHDIPMALRLADRVAVFGREGLLAWGTPEEIFAGGVIGRALGVRLHRMETADGTQYYCTKEDT